MEILRFAANEPVELALKFADGKPVEGRFGDQVLYTLTDDRVMYLDPAVAQRIKELRIARGELFSICKREVKRNSKRSIDWEVKRVDPPGDPSAAPAPAPALAVVSNGHQRPATDTASALEQQLAASLRKTQADSAVMTAIEACSKGEKYAAAIGYACHFEHEDVRALAISILIGAQQNGGAR